MADLFDYQELVRQAQRLLREGTKIRPDTEDFWLMADIFTSTDAQSDAGVDFEDITGRIITPEVLIYVAQQRVVRMLRGTPLSATLMAKMTGIWIDAFTMATQYQHRKEERDRQAPPDTEE